MIGPTCPKVQLAPVSPTNTTFFRKPPTTFLTCCSRGKRRKYAGKKVRLNQVSNSQPPGHESETLTTEPSGRGVDSVTSSTLVCIKTDSILNCQSRDIKKKESGIQSNDGEVTRIYQSVCRISS